MHIKVTICLRPFFQSKSCGPDDKIIYWYGNTMILCIIPIPTTLYKYCYSIATFSHLNFKSSSMRTRTVPTAILHQDLKLPHHGFHTFNFQELKFQQPIATLTEKWIIRNKKAVEGSKWHERQTFQFFLNLQSWIEKSSWQQHISKEPLNNVNVNFVIRST